MDLWEEAKARHEAHLGHASHRPLSKDYELVGLRGEEVFAIEFDGKVDLVRRLSGDGGVDHVIWVPYKVDVKCARKAYNLAVEVGKVDKETIYVLAGYDDATDRATLLGWEWGSRLLRATVKDFGYGIDNHCIPRRDLRAIAELKQRLAPIWW